MITPMDQRMIASNDMRMEDHVEDSSPSEGKAKASAHGQSSGCPIPTRTQKLLPSSLVEMWTEVDPALPREDIQNIFQTTFAEFRVTAPLYAQPWMYVGNKSKVTDIEKARISNGGKIPALWKAAAEHSEHGRKWLKINREQEQREALVRARENARKSEAGAASAQAQAEGAATLHRRAICRAHIALDNSKTAAKLAAEAKESADKACEEAEAARLIWKDASAASLEATVTARDAASEVKRLEEAVKTVSRGKKRMLDTPKPGDA